MEFDYKEFLPNFIFYLNSMLNYEFNFDNPLLWVIMLSLLWILLQKWDTKKAFQFWLALTLILLGTTKIEDHYAILHPESGQYFDATIIKLISGFVAAMMFLAYYFLG